VPDERPDEPLDTAEPPLRVPTEGERATTAAILGTVLGAILAALGRRR
jgi:hypothetical protein